MRAATTVRFDPAARLQGEIRPPADKSISHRAAILGAMAQTPVRVVNYLAAADTHSTLDAVRALGAAIARRDDGTLTITGVGLRGARAPGRTIDVGNAGTLMRLLPGWLAAQEGRAFTLDGDDSIRRRPVDRIATPLTAMGARIEARDGRLPPFTVRGAPLHGTSYELPVASAQIKSAIALAALNARGRTTIREPAPSRDHTERMLAAAGAAVRRSGAEVRIDPAPDDGLRIEALTVPGDPSSAAFAIVAALLVPGSHVVVRGASANWTRTGFVRIARRMGARIDGELETDPGDAIPRADPIGDLEVRASELRATVVEPAEVPLAIDELPLVALLGCFADGTTVVRGAQELRLKETDRIATVVDGLRGLGADIEATDDGFAVGGTGGLRGGAIASHGDHRLAMLGAVAGLASRDGVEVAGMDAAAVSYPAFEADIAALVKERLRPR
jgi:3-phosphoshikimate 1-carboxyvinyltransferase